jgi:hypothetical protein
MTSAKSGQSGSDQLSISAFAPMRGVPSHASIERSTFRTKWLSLCSMRPFPRLAIVALRTGSTDLPDTLGYG